MSNIANRRPGLGGKCRGTVMSRMGMGCKEESRAQTSDCARVSRLVVRTLARALGLVDFAFACARLLVALVVFVSNL